MSRHRHVDTEISGPLDWTHGVQNDLCVAAWNAVATTGGCTADVVRLERVQLQSVAARPLQP